MGWLYVSGYSNQIHTQLHLCIFCIVTRSTKLKSRHSIQSQAFTTANLPLSALDKGKHTPLENWSTLAPHNKAVHSWIEIRAVQQGPIKFRSMHGYCGWTEVDLQTDFCSTTLLENSHSTAESLPTDRIQTYSRKDSPSIGWMEKNTHLWSV